MTTQTQEAIELCIFKLAPGADAAEFEASNKEVNEWVNQQPGFMFRCLSQKEDGTWMDIVHWDSMVSAQQAGDAFIKELGGSQFMKLIDQDSVSMNHGYVKHAAPAQAAA